MEKENVFLSQKITTFHFKTRKKSYLVSLWKNYVASEKKENLINKKRKITQIGLNYMAGNCIMNKIDANRNIFNLDFNQRNLNQQY